MIAIDTETTLIEPGKRIPDLVCLTFCTPGYKGILHRRGGIRVWTRDGQEQRATGNMDLFLAELFRDPLIIGHNLAFDLAVLIRAYPDRVFPIWQALDEGRISDTLIRDKLLYIAAGRLQFDPTANQKPRFSLADLAQRHLGKILDKGADTWRLRYGELIDVPLSEWPESALDYALGDAEVTFDVYAKQGRSSPDEALQVRAAWSLLLMASWGMTTDQDAVAALRSRLVQTCAEYEERLRPHGLVDGNGKRSMTAIRALLGDNAVRTDPSPRFPQGQIRTDGDTLRESGNPILVTLADYLEVKKNLTDFLPKLTPLVQCSFDSLVSSGRVSCYGPNLEQVPRKGGVRECFVPRPGCVFVDADYSAAELCAIAELCYVQFGYSKLGDALNEGIDVHMLVGAQLIGATYEQAMADRARWKADPTYAPGKTANDARELGKRGNFGYWGGMGAGKFVLVCRAGGVRIEWAEAARVKVTIQALFPEINDYFGAVAERGEPHTFIQHKSGRVRGGLGYCDGCNTQFQGLVADGTKAMLYRLSRACYLEAGVLQGCRPVNFIHDEVMVEVPEERAEAAKAEIERIMVAAMAEWITRVPVKVEARITTRWEK